MNTNRLSLGPTISDLRVLNLDDNPAARYAKGAGLRRAGFNVLDAADGAEALKILAVEDIDVAVLDVHLPDISGLEVTRRIRTDPATRAIKIVQVSATYLDDGDEASSLERGADIYLRSPFELEALSAVVETLGRIRRSEALVADIDGPAAPAPAIGAVQFDSSGYVVATNLAYCQLLKRDSQQLCLLSLDQLLYPGDVDRVTGLFREMLSGSSEEFRTEARQVAGDGSLVLLDCSFSVMRSIAGAVRGVLCSVVAASSANPVSPIR